jgi:predicted Fe-Mo cluster-binding NifX family protein
MKIAFPLLNENKLAIDFAHASYIGIYDDKENTTELIPLLEMTLKSGFSVFFDALISQGLTSVISPYYSYMSLRIFKENEIETLKAMDRSLEENIRHFNEKTLKPFSIYESLQPGDCVSNCSSCGTSCSN